MNVYEGTRVRPVVEHRTSDVDSYVACTCLGEQNSPIGPWKRTTAYPSRRVFNDGDDTTVTAVVTGSNPFKHVAAGDSINFLGEHVATAVGGSRRTVASKTTSDEIEVNSAIGLGVVPADEAFKVQESGYEFLFLTLACESVIP